MFEFKRPRLLPRTLIALLVCTAGAFSMGLWVESGGPLRARDSGGALTFRYPDAETLSLAGIIAAGDAQEFEIALRAGTKRVVLNSGGGDALECMKIAKTIHARQLDIVVDGLCASGCANYLFVAAAKKTVRPWSLVVLHGGTSFSLAGLSNDAKQFAGWYAEAHQHELLANPDRRAHSDLELALYRQVGVDPALIHISTAIAASTGQWDYRERWWRSDHGRTVDGQYPIAKWSQSTITDAKVGWWAPPPDEMARLGIRDIESVWFPESELALKFHARMLLGGHQHVNGRALAAMTFPVIE
ncbi:MAG: hypothetical protein JNJ55_05800 [Betaproteobacteria bacterium]|nr:hypothetical protein [Betaproteobacteria bacterium]